MRLAWDAETLPSPQPRGMPRVLTSRLARGMPEAE